MNITAGLEVRGVTVVYGAHIAVHQVSLDAPLERITALIGPNGAGKTSTFNVCSGLLEPTEGTVHFAARDLSGLPPHRRAQLGIGRTFQRMELFDSLSVRDNVELGHEAGLAGSRILGHLFSPRSEVEATRRIAQDSIAMCGIGHLADRAVVELSTGQRRLVELARAIASGPHLLLLDEPSSGLDHRETAEFGEVLSNLVAERGIGILIVEHDMSLVMSIADYIYVLDFGSLIFEGSPAEVASSALVRSSYLGEGVA